LPAVSGVGDVGMDGGCSGVGGGTEGIVCWGVGTGTDSGAGVGCVCAESVETTTNRAGAAKKREVLIRTYASNFPQEYRHQCNRRTPCLSPQNDA
jgi:hypothetical protein